MDRRIELVRKDLVARPLEGIVQTYRFLARIFCLLLILTDVAVQLTDGDGCGQLWALGVLRLGNLGQLRFVADDLIAQSADFKLVVE